MNMSQESIMNQCPMCENSMVRKAVACKVGRLKGTVLTFHSCVVCNSVFAPENTHKYISVEDFEDIGEIVVSDGRTGDGEEWGREAYLAKYGLQIFRSTFNDAGKKDVLFFGAGISGDHKIISKFPDVNVRITDLDNFQNEPNFIPLDDKSKFDLVIISEVIEHFENPEADLENVYSKIKDDGLIICTTNINDTYVSLERLDYPFIPGHTCYYSGLGLISSALKSGLHVDFRNLEGSQGKLGPRKKVIFRFKNMSFYTSLSEFFSRHWLFPSEKSKK
jgi:SAM-dependent methyltransferase